MPDQYNPILGTSSTSAQVSSGFRRSPLRGGLEQDMPYSPLNYAAITLPLFYNSLAVVLYLEIDTAYPFVKAPVHEIVSPPSSDIQELHIQALIHLIDLVSDHIIGEWGKLLFGALAPLRLQLLLLNSQTLCCFVVEVCDVLINIPACFFHIPSVLNS